MSELTRLTVNLTRGAAAALDEASERSGDSRTDTVNRALILYGLLQQAIQDGGGRLRFEQNDGTKATVMVL